MSWPEKTCWLCPLRCRYSGAPLLFSSMELGCGILWEEFSGSCSWALGLPCGCCQRGLCRNSLQCSPGSVLLRDLLRFPLPKEETWFPNCLILASINLLEQSCCFSTSPTFQAAKLETGGVHPVLRLLSHSSGVFIKAVFFSPALPGASDLCHQSLWLPRAL